MISTILGTKQGMGQSFTVTGRRLAVGMVKSGPNTVTQIKTGQKDGYSAVQLGFGSRRVKNITKPQIGHLKGVAKEGATPRFLREVRGGDPSVSTSAMSSVPNGSGQVGGDEGHKIGDVISPSDVLKPGDLVSVTGISKGKGFAGVVKRWHFAGGPKTHGQSDRLRAPGSIGQGTTPGRVYKGKRMAGRMGNDRVTVKNLTVLSVDQEGNIKLSGPIPGSRGGLLLINKIGESKKFEPEVKDGNK